MTKSRIVGFLFDAWDDFDSIVEGLDPTEALLRPNGGSSYAWTYAHMGASTDTWINVRVRGMRAHPYIGQERFRTGGTGVADQWDAVRKGVGEVRASVCEYLMDLTDEALLSITTRGASLPGRLGQLNKGGPVPLYYILLRLCAHHYYHIGEIGAKRDKQGQQVGDYPGLLERCL